MFIVSKNLKNALSENNQFTSEMLKILKKHRRQNWGDVSEAEKQRNDKAYEYKNDSILAMYNTSEGKVYINANANRNQTNILFSTEYKR